MSLCCSLFWSLVLFGFFCVFFFKRKTAYEMRISDWSSDVCSSDLLVIDDPEGRPSAIAPAYAKSHSQGEYVFDQNWADAYMRAGGAYYPKLQLAVPFTPVPGPRLLLRDPGQAAALIAAAETLTRDHGLSSAHRSEEHTSELQSL